MTDALRQLRELLDAAERAGVDRALLRRVGPQLLDALLCVDGRKLRALTLARRAAHLRNQGLSLRAVAERVEESPSAVFRALEQFADTTTPEVNHVHSSR